jgi:hypothetical protein
MASAKDHDVEVGLTPPPSPGALEKQKLVYVMNRDAAGRLTISSPLEAHKSQTLVYSVVGLDVGTDNPTFAAIERDYGKADLVGESPGAPN